MQPGFIRVRNTVTGAISAVPAGALRHFPDHVAEEGPVPERTKPKQNLPKSQPHRRRNRGQ